MFRRPLLGQAGLDGTTRALTKRGLKVHSSSTVKRNPANITEAVTTICHS